MKKIAAILFFILLILNPISLNAQPGNPNPGPISGGLIFLLLGGLTLGVINLRKKNKEL